MTPADTPSPSCSDPAHFEDHTLYKGEHRLQLLIDLYLSPTSKNIEVLKYSQAQPQKILKY